MKIQLLLYLDAWQDESEIELLLVSSTLTKQMLLFAYCIKDAYIGDSLSARKMEYVDHKVSFNHQWAPHAENLHSAIYVKRCLSSRRFVELKLLHLMRWQ